MRIKRRDFLGRVAAGGAVLSMPAILASCGVAPATDVNTAAPPNPFLEWFGIDEATVRTVLSALTSNGADTAELYFQHRRTALLDMDDGIVSRADTEIDQGLGLRVVIGDSVGYASTDDLTLPSMLAAAQRAAAMAKGQAVAVPESFSTTPPGGLYRTEVAWTDVGAERKLPILERVDRYARLADLSVANVSVQLADVDERVLIATLDGHLVSDHRPLTRLSTQVTAVRGREWQRGFSNISARESLSWYTDERIDRMVREAVDRSLIRFEAREPPAGEVPVILRAGASGILLHEAIGHALEADFNRDGTSVYAGQVGENVAGSIVTLVDEATIPNARGALNYDDEGTACSRNVLVENGVLRSYLHDATTARQFGVATTGSARRESWRVPPMPRMTCTYIEAGPHTQEEIFASVDKGIVADVFADGRVQLGAGEFTFQVRNGRLVEKGRATAPIRDFTLSGNGPRMLRGMSMVADDACFDTGGWTCGKKGQRVPVSQGMPTVLVSGLSVGAAVLE